MIFMILAWKKQIIFLDVRDSGVELYEFQDFHDSVLEYLNFHDFRNSGVEF